MMRYVILVSGWAVAAMVAGKVAAHPPVSLHSVTVSEPAQPAQ